jgi:hypothetical protein
VLHFVFASSYWHENIMEIFQVFCCGNGSCIGFWPGYPLGGMKPANNTLLSIGEALIQCASQAGQGRPGIFDRCKRLKMEEVENRAF